MGIPQIIVIIFYSLGLGITMTMHGKAIEGKYNFFTKLFATAIMIGLLVWGGFFK